MLHPVTITGEGGGAVKPVNRQIERSMGLAQIGGHRIGIIKIGKAGGGMHRPGIQNGLGKGFDFDALCGGGVGPGEGVVNEADGIAETAFQSPTNMGKPRHMCAACENGEIVVGCVGQNSDKIAWYCRRLEPSDRDIIPAFGANLWDGEKR